MFFVVRTGNEKIYVWNLSKERYGRCLEKIWYCWKLFLGRIEESFCICCRWCILQYSSRVLLSTSALALVRKSRSFSNQNDNQNIAVIKRCPKKYYFSLWCCIFLLFTYPTIAVLTLSYYVKAFYEKSLL